MDFNQCSESLQTILMNAINIAKSYKHPMIDTVECLKAIFENDVLDGLFKRVNINKQQALNIIDNEMLRVAAVSDSSEPRISSTVNESIMEAEKWSEAHQESYMSTASFFFALLRNRSTISKQLVKELRINLSQLENEEITRRGGKKMDTQTSENNIEALAKYGRDLVKDVQDGKIDPVRDIETINLELIFSDLEILERRIAKTTKAARMDKTAAKELELQQRIKAHLEDGKPAITLETENEDEEAWLQEYNLLTAKPVIFAANVSEDDLADDGASNPHVQAVRELAKEQNSGVFVICAEIEQEIAELEDDEKKMFLDDLGIQESGLEKLIKASYELLGLMSYLTAGEDETRAWTIKVGTKAPQAAGKIHTDFERGFIKAEVVNYKDLLESGSYAGAREKGLVRMEGKEYVVKDGDVILFRFNV